MSGRLTGLTKAFGAVMQTPSNYLTGVIRYGFGEMLSPLGRRSWSRDDLSRWAPLDLERSLIGAGEGSLGLNYDSDGPITWSTSDPELFLA